MAPPRPPWPLASEVATRDVPKPCRLPSPGPDCRGGGWWRRGVLRERFLLQGPRLGWSPRPGTCVGTGPWLASSHWVGVPGGSQRRAAWGLALRQAGGGALLQGSCLEPSLGQGHKFGRFQPRCRRLRDPCRLLAGQGPGEPGQVLPGPGGFGGRVSALQVPERGSLQADAGLRTGLSHPPHRSS